ncbi:MAG: hypothetical protein ACNA78_03955 [Balneolaceae bacterium]
MEELNGITIYWLISIGLLVGLIVDFFIGKRGVSLGANLFGGAAGSVIIGVVMILLGVFAPLVYAALGSIAFLFLCNVFSFDHKHGEDARTSA